MRFLILVLLLALLVTIALAKKDTKKETSKGSGSKKTTQATKETKETKKDSPKKDSPKKDAAKKDTLKKDSAKKNAAKKDDPKKKEQKSSSFWFKGKDEWGEISLKKCYKEQPLKEDYMCYKYYRNYEPVYIDPLETNPIIIVYRRLIPKQFIDAFLSDVRRKRKRDSEKKKLYQDFMAQFMSGAKRRVLNETIVSHASMSGVARVFRRIQSLIPAVNFTYSGAWQVQFYQKGGHHAPHYDYITYSSPDQFSRTTRQLGNRFLTFTIALKTAQIGGETVFIHVNQTATLEPGDALLFTTVNKDMTPAIGAAHAECPVQKGEKITATLYLRPRYQELFWSHSQEPNLFAYDIEKLIAPQDKNFWLSPVYDFYAYREMMMEAMAQEYMKKHKS